MLDWIRNKDPKVSLGHASILAKLLQEQKALGQRDSAFIRHFEYDVKNSFQFEENSLHKQNYLFEEFCYQVAEKAMSISPDMISIGAFIWNEIHVQRILKILREDFHYKNKICLGGPQISYALPSTLESFYPNADIFIRGYAEDSFTKLVFNQAEAKRKLTTNVSKVPGVHLYGEVDLGLQSKSSLESLPSPFLDSIIHLDRSFIRWESQRGCPFKCTFCQHRDSYERIIMFVTNRA